MNKTMSFSVRLPPALRGRLDQTLKEVRRRDRGMSRSRLVMLMIEAGLERVVANFPVEARRRVEAETIKAAAEAEAQRHKASKSERDDLFVAARSRQYLENTE